MAGYSVPAGPADRRRSARATPGRLSCCADPGWPRRPSWSDVGGFDADAPAPHALAVDRRRDALGVRRGNRQEGEVLEHLDVADRLAVEMGGAGHRADEVGDLDPR